MAHNPTLLIVDDCEIDREVFRSYLSEDDKTSYEIIEVEEASAGLDLCNKVQCDLILLDFRLPDMTGLEFLQYSRQRGDLLPPVIMMTGEGCESIAVQAIKQGAENYLPKQDLEAETFIQAVREAIGQQRLKSVSADTVLPEAMAAAVIRFRQALQLEELTAAAAAEIRHLADAERVRIYQGDLQADAEPLAESLSPALSQCLRNDAEARKPRRGRPRKSQPPAVKLPELTAMKLPILGGSSHPYSWGWVVLECSPDSMFMAEQQQEAFTALVAQLAIGIDHAQQLRDGIESIDKCRATSQHKTDLINQTAVKARQALAGMVTASTTLARHRQHLNEEQQTRFLNQLEQQSREFVEMLEHLQRSQNLS